TKHLENAAIIDIKERQVCASTFGFNPDGGLIVVKAKTFILVATYRVGMYPSVCVEAVEKLGEGNGCSCVPACQHFVG
ncbi:PREDICTED: profilin-4, partial [Eurypyga helias]|uniref:profilin-4 n=1 Tax=Eurypyga helias TaxID=54383 RepID=UPI000528A2DF